jgi:ABC-type uncharacterized transport system permease subunit
MEGGYSAYVSVLKQQFLNSLAKLMSFRLSFFLSVLFDIAAFVTFYFTTDILFLHITSIGGWTREHFLFFIFWMQSINCLHSAIAAPNFWNFATEIRNGNLDFRLLRPLGSLFDIFTAVTRPIGLVVLPVLIGFMMYYGMLLNVTVWGWLAMPFLWLLSFVLLALLEILMSMGLLWTKGGDGINFVRIHAQQFERWPDFVYPRPLRLLCTRVFPILAAGTFSVKAVLGIGEWWEVPFLVVMTIVIWFVIGKVWMLGLRQYESASS